MKLHIALSTLALAALGACAGASASDPSLSSSRNDGPSLPAQTTLAIGQFAEFASANLRVKFESLEGDSRCPAAVVCIWEGSVIIKVTASHLTGPEILQVATLETVAGKDTTKLFGTPVRLVRIDPPKLTTDSLPKSVYRAVLMIGAEK